MAHLLLYGGTFDPIHHGHLITCRRAREIIRADAVLLIPARVSPHKVDPGDGLAAGAAQRLAMLRLAIAEEPGFAIDERELSREGPSYTVDTVESLVRERPADRFTLLIGADQIPKFQTWHRVQEMLAHVEVAVLPRPARRGAELAAALEEVRTRLGAAGVRVQALDTPLLEISATEIRQRVRAGLPIRYLVPSSVGQYISDERLYRAAR